jgi:hypothetical protein
MTHAYATGYTTSVNRKNALAKEIMALALGAALMFVILTFGFAWQPWAEGSVTPGQGGGDSEPQHRQVYLPLEDQWQLESGVPFITGPCGCGSQLDDVPLH